MNVSAVQNEVSRLRAVERARMIARMRRSASLSGTQSLTNVQTMDLQPPLDSFNAANLSPLNSSIPNFNDGLLA